VKLSRAKIICRWCLGPALALAVAFPAAASEYACSGTEPFWSLSIGGAEAAFSDPEGGPDKLAAVEPARAAGTVDDYVLVFETRSTAHPSRTYTAVLHKDDEGNCSDGMSDIEYPYNAVLIAPHRVLRGCCAVK